MSYRSHELPREAPESARIAIVEALRNDNYSIFSDGRAFLRRQQFEPTAVVDDLIAYLNAGARLYLLPGTVGQRIKFQCCLRYEFITVHAKIGRGKDEAADGWYVMLGFHEHNTGHEPLPE